MECVRCYGTGKIEVVKGLAKECTLCKGEKDISLKYTLQWIVGHYELGTITAKQAMTELIRMFIHQEVWDVIELGQDALAKKGRDRC